VTPPIDRLRRLWNGSVKRVVLNLSSCMSRPRSGAPHAIDRTHFAGSADIETPLHGSAVMGPARQDSLPIEKRFNEASLDDFVEMVDRNGGADFVGASPQWQRISYTPTVVVDVSLDPFSEAYTAQQIELYEEIAGRVLDQSVNEDTAFDFDHNVTSPNPYGVRDPTRMALHYARLSKLLRLAAPPVEARVLDMGSGWGLSSEFFAMLGCRVTAIDINESFVRLTTERNKRLRFDLEAFRGSFDDVALSGEFDLIVFYECLHHAVRPWDVIARLARHLAPNGAIGFAGEPVNDFWWPQWGIRLDPLSVYCIRKFGWFESGWSQVFISNAMSRAGLDVRVAGDADPAIGPVLVASRTAAAPADACRGRTS
jgi:2-polyprenyl-3-methyl-5-hydroxy-6-metoxy-1,4-benzoquinol methylase